MSGRRNPPKEPLNVLVTIDAGYAGPFATLAKSVIANNPGCLVRFFLVHSSIPTPVVDGLRAFCMHAGAELHAFRIDEGGFGDARATKRYPLEVYYRLLAPFALPTVVERVIYLDCDTLVVNSLEPLMSLDLQGHAYAAASHAGEVSAIERVNQLRLGTDHAYFNTGLIVMDVRRAREVMTPEKLIECVDDLGSRMVLPDQDVFNVVCGESCVLIDDERWNYDVRLFAQYLTESRGEHGVDRVMRNTAVLHFCGPRKPWKKSYRGRFGMLYKHYMQLAARDFAETFGTGFATDELPRLLTS